MGVLSKSAIHIGDVSTKKLRQAQDSFHTASDKAQTHCLSAKDCVVSTVYDTGLTSGAKFKDNVSKDMERMLGALKKNLQIIQPSIEALYLPVYERCGENRIILKVNEKVCQGAEYVKEGVNSGIQLSGAKYEQGTVFLRAQIDFLIETIHMLAQRFAGMDAVVWSKKQLFNLFSMIMEATEHLIGFIHPLYQTYLAQPANRVQKLVADAAALSVNKLVEMRNNMLLFMITTFQKVDDRMVTPAFEYSQEKCLVVYGAGAETVLGVTTYATDKYDAVKTCLETKVENIKVGVVNTKTSLHNNVNDKVVLPIKNKIVMPINNHIVTPVNEKFITPTYNYCSTTTTSAAISTKTNLISTSAWLDHKLSLTGWLWLAVDMSRKVDGCVLKGRIEEKIVAPAMTKGLSKANEMDLRYCDGRGKYFVQDIVDEFGEKKEKYTTVPELTADTGGNVGDVPQTSPLGRVFGSVMEKMSYPLKQVETGSTDLVANSSNGDLANELISEAGYPTNVIQEANSESATTPQDTNSTESEKYTSPSKAYGGDEQFGKSPTKGSSKKGKNGHYKGGKKGGNGKK